MNLAASAGLMTTDTMPVNVALLNRLHPMEKLSPMRRADLASVSRHSIYDHLRYALPLPAWHAEGQVVYLLKGQLKLEYKNGRNCVLVGGSPESALPLGCQREIPQGAKTVTSVEILRLDGNLLDLTVTWDEMARQELQGGIGTDWTAMNGMLAASSLSSVFAALPPAHIDLLLNRFERRPVNKGEVVIRQGDPGDFYYVIERGRCRVERQVGSSLIPLADLGDGHAFGEEALISDGPRNATITMETDGLLLCLKKSDFVELLREPYLQKLSWPEAQARVALGACWLDVRFPAEFQQDGLAGAINVPLNELRQALPLLDEKKEYIVYCQSGRRSAAAAFLMAQKGLHAYLLAEPFCLGNTVFGGAS